MRLKEIKEISVALVSPQEIRKINKKYRRKNKITNVLSFNYKDGTGEIIINNKEKNFPLLFFHGLFHILGYSHAQMEKNKFYAELEKISPQF